MAVKSIFRVFSQHFGNMTRPLELGIFASFYTKLGKNTPYNKNKNIKYFVYSTSYSSLTHKQILKSDLQSDLPFVVGAQKNPLELDMYLVCSGTHQTIDCHRCCHDLNECHHTEKVHQRMSTDNFLWKQTVRHFSRCFYFFGLFGGDICRILRC